MVSSNGRGHSRHIVNIESGRACVHSTSSGSPDKNDYQSQWFVVADDALRGLVGSGLDAGALLEGVSDEFVQIFDDEFESNWKDKFAKESITYFFTLIDDAAARIIRSEGGFLWALKNYDGDVMSDLIASGCGSLAMMTSVLVSPHGYFEYEAAHGTVQKHYYNYLKGQATSTNSMALIFAWTGALRKRGELDGTPEIVDFAGKVEKAALDTVEKGIMTGDLLMVALPGPDNRKVGTEEFIDAIAAELASKL